MPLPSNHHLELSPPSSGRIVIGLCAAFGLAVLAASQLDYSQKEYVNGFLQSRGGEFRVVAPATGVVQFEATLGQTLKQGQAVASVKAVDTMVGGTSLREKQRDALKSKLSSVTAELAGSLPALQDRVSALAAQRNAAQTSVEQARLEVRTRQTYVRLEEEKLLRQRGLHQQGFVSQQALEQAESDLLARRADLHSAERAVTQAQAQVASSQADLAATQAQLNSQREQLSREQHSLGQQRDESLLGSTAVVNAPHDAQVVALAIQSGDAVQQGQLLAKLTPAKAPLEVQLLLPSSAAGRVQPGQTVSLQLLAFPYQTYGLVKARVTQLDSGAVLADETALRSQGVPAGALVVKATAEIVQVPPKLGGLAALRSGMQVRAAVEVERKTFLAWMTWPLLKFFV